jgi:glyoxylase-like metal-dependent hydrolase (beta-lactamase superfamily II)
MAVSIKEVAQSTYLLDCGEVPLFMMPQVAYLLVDHTSVLIEPGATVAASRLLEDSDRLRLHLDKVSYIIPTHIHVDHGGGAGYLAQKLPQAKVVLHPRGAPHMIDPSKLIQGTRLAFGENFEEGFGPILPIPEGQIHIARDGEEIRLGKRELRILFSPGHASHHISMLDSLTGGLFCGEALGFPLDSAPDVVLPAGIPPFDPEAYLETIKKLEKLSPKLLFYSHIGVRNNVDNQLIRRVKKNSIAFAKIVQEAVQAGEDDQKIMERLSKYVESCSPKARLPESILTNPSGYIDYFRNKR